VLDAEQIALAGPTLWSNRGLSIAGNASLVVNDGLLVGRFGDPPQPFNLGLMGVSGAATNDFGQVSFLRSRFVGFPAAEASRGGGLLYTYGSNSRGFDLSLEKFVESVFTDVDLGVLPTAPLLQYDVPGPYLDGPGVGGFPGRWWVADVPYFTQGYTCDPAPRGNVTSDKLCAAPGYLSLHSVALGNGVGSPSQFTYPEIELARDVSGSPRVTFPAIASAQNPFPDRSSAGLPVPTGETVTLRFLSRQAESKVITYQSWGRPNQRATLRIPYPAGTTVSLSERPLYYGPAVPYTAVASRAALEAGDSRQFFFDAATNSLYISLRTGLAPVNGPALVTVTASNAVLP
jgi:hypothetical protein